jgi:hypothetical protein
MTHLLGEKCEGDNALEAYDLQDTRKRRKIERGAEA